MAVYAAPFSKLEIPGLDYVVFVWGSITAMRLPRRSLLVGSVLRQFFEVLRLVNSTITFANCQILCCIGGIKVYGEEFVWLLMLVLLLGVCSWCDGLQCSC